MPLAPELRDDLGGAGNEVGIARRNGDVLRHEHGVDRVDVGLGRRMPWRCRPSLGDAGQRHQGCDMRALGHAHRPPRFVDR